MKEIRNINLSKFQMLIDAEDWFNSPDVDVTDRIILLTFVTHLTKRNKNVKTDDLEYLASLIISGTNRYLKHAEVMKKINNECCSTYLEK